MIDPISIRRWFEIFHSEEPLTEVRILGEKTYSGYFVDCDTLLASLRGHEDEAIYAPINTIKPACLGKAQSQKLLSGKGLNTTSDNDIDYRRWVLIDLDPKRVSGVNATDSEKAFAKVKMRQIGSFLRDQGFSSPVVVDSGNGYHLYYKVFLANSAENTELIKQFLLVLDMYFSDEHTDVDTSVFNASRISKIVGTTSAKGTSTLDRPQRLSGFVQVPDEIKETDKHYLEVVAAMMPEAEKPSFYNSYGRDRFDIEGFIRDHDIKIAKRIPFKGGEKLILEECPFDSGHKAPDSALFVMPSGAIGFKCLHNSCSCHTWKDFRLKYDPQAYDRREFEAFSSRQAKFSVQDKPKPTILAESSDKGHKWQTLKDVEWVDPSSLTYIGTGFTELDNKIGGLALGDVTIISGLAGAGKTSIINNVILDAVQHGYKVATWSGELQASRFQAWIDQCAAGRNFVKSKAGYSNWYYCPKEIADKINDWLDGRLWLYNNEYGAKWSQLFSDITEAVENLGTQLVILDNLMSLSLDSFSGEKNERQTAFINELKTYAKKANIAVILVCHPRKEQMNSLLRMESISGTFDLVNLADNILLIHRVGKDFDVRASAFFGAEMVSEYRRYHEVIEVAKNRSMGIKDFLVGLFFEVESRRFLNTEFEYKTYGWQEALDAPIVTSPIPYMPSANAEEWEMDDLPE